MTGRFALVGILAVAAVAVGMLGCGKEGPLEPTPNCSIAIAPASRSFSSDGGAGTIEVSTSPECAWAAVASAPWISVTEGANSTGHGTAKYTVAANAATDARTGSVTIGGQVHSIAQQGHAVCTLELSPSSVSLAKDGGAGSFTVTSPGGCAWTATSTASWLTVTSGSQGSGNGTVSYFVAANPEIPGRNATIAVGDRTFSVTQFGDVSRCEYQVSPVQLGVCMLGFPLSATVTTSATCPWTANSSVSWMSITQGESGVGSGVITIRPTDNWDIPRDGTIMVRWPTITAGQNVHVEQGGCNRTVSPDYYPVSSFGGTRSFSVRSVPSYSPVTGDCGGRTGDTCYTLAESRVPWITVKNGGPYFDQDIPSIEFTVAPNPNHTSRLGDINLRYTNVFVLVAQDGVAEPDHAVKGRLR